MEIEKLEKNGYYLLRVKEDLKQETDMTPLKEIAQSAIKENNSNIAIAFTYDSNFFSCTIAILVQILGLVKEFGGRLSVIHPNADMLEMIRIVGLEKLIDMHTSEETIGI